MVPILINKNVSEPSYNDLKLTIQKQSYFGNSLIPPWNPSPLFSSFLLSVPFFLLSLVEQPPSSMLPKSLYPE